MQSVEISLSLSFAVVRLKIRPCHKSPAGVKASFSEFQAEIPKCLRRINYGAGMENEQRVTYTVTHQVSDYYLLTLIWEFHHVAYSARFEAAKQDKADIITTKSK